MTDKSYEPLTTDFRFTYIKDKRDLYATREQYNISYPSINSFSDKINNDHIFLKQISIQIMRLTGATESEIRDLIG